MVAGRVCKQGLDGPPSAHHDRAADSSHCRLNAPMGVSTAENAGHPQVSGVYADQPNSIVQRCLGGSDEPPVYTVEERAGCPLCRWWERLRTMPG